MATIQQISTGSVCLVVVSVASVHLTTLISTCGGMTEKRILRICVTTAQSVTGLKWKTSNTTAKTPNITARTCNSTPLKIMSTIRAKLSYMPVSSSAATPSVHGILSHCTKCTSSTSQLRTISGLISSTVLQRDLLAQTAICISSALRKLTCSVPKLNSIREMPLVQHRM